MDTFARLYLNRKAIEKLELVETPDKDPSFRLLNKLHSKCSIILQNA